MNTPTSTKLAAKVALVTGASKGIGAAIARQLAAAGAAVVVNYASDATAAARVVDAIKAAGGQALAVRADVTQPADIQRLVAEAVAAFGHLDIVVNNAGTYAFQPLDAITPEHFHQHFNLNVLATLLVTQAAVRHFPATGGSVVNIGSVVSDTTPPGSSVLSASKAAVDALTRVLSKELGPRHIRVNALNPGYTLTEGLRATGIPGSPFETAAVNNTPLGRLGDPEEVARAAVFLASDDAAWITGDALRAAGGIY